MDRADIIASYRTAFDAVLLLSAYALVYLRVCCLYRISTL